MKQLRFIEGEWMDNKQVLDFLVERLFQLQIRIQELESNKTTYTEEALK